jgi:uncharacterized membrane protein
MENKKAKKLIVFLIFIGLGISGYLTYYKLNASPWACNFGGCDKVQNSKYSIMFGLPVATWGIIYYIALLITYLRKWELLTKLWLAWGIIFSTYLTYIEISKIHAICGWCALSYLIIIIITYLYFKKEKLSNDNISG